MSSIVDVLDADERLDALVEALHHPAAGRVVVHILPTTRNLEWAAHAVHRALGKNLETGGLPSGAELNWLVAQSWLAGERIHDLFILDAQELPQRLRARFFEAAAVVDLALWLIDRGDGQRKRRERHNREWAVQDMTVTAFADRWGETALAASDAHDDDRPAALSMPLPDDEFLTFRASCRDLLTTDEFKAVDAVWMRTYRATARWALTSPAASRDDITGFVRDEIRRASRPNEALIRLRAVQAAFFVARTFITVNADRFLKAAVHEAPLGTLLAEPDVLRVLVHPAHAAAAVLSSVTGMTAQEIADLDLSDLAEDGTVIAGPGRQWPVPTQLTPALRAHWFMRAFQDSPERSLFLATRPGGQSYRPTVTSVQTLLRGAAQRTGLPMLRHYTKLFDDTAENWRNRTGILIRHL